MRPRNPCSTWILRFLLDESSWGEEKVRKQSGREGWGRGEGEEKEEWLRTNHRRRERESEGKHSLFPTNYSQNVKLEMLGGLKLLNISVQLKQWACWEGASTQSLCTGGKIASPEMETVGGRGRRRSVQRRVLLCSNQSSLTRWEIHVTQTLTCWKQS